MTDNEIKELNDRFKELSPIEVLKYSLDKYGSKIALATNLGLEDQVLTDMIFSIDHNARIFTLDTELLFEETYSLIKENNNKYHSKIEVYLPAKEDIEKAFEDRPFHSIYDSRENRSKCCHARKVIPLKKVLKTLDVWITGLRKEQSVNRKDDQLIEWDNKNEIIKLSPLIDWTEDQVWDYIRKNNVPYNPLHDKGYPSIGCHPCTRAVEPGEDSRAGRWWWENPSFSECGLHKRVE